MSIPITFLTRDRKAREWVPQLTVKWPAVPRIGEQIMTHPRPKSRQFIVKDVLYRQGVDADVLIDLYCDEATDG